VILKRLSNAFFRHYLIEFKIKPVLMILGMFSKGIPLLIRLKEHGLNYCVKLSFWGGLLIPVAASLSELRYWSEMRE
jgi:hypothetical protein